MALFKQSSLFHIWLSTLLSTLFAHPVLADDEGDNFINNLLTDIAPILALFGERVTTQFLSRSFSVYDCIIFAACPIGIVTATVSAIRVAAPNSWRSLIGRAMESRATTELELLSSTSADVCELWSGSGLVRVMGSPGILELLYFPKDPDPPHFGLFTLNEGTEDRPRTESQCPHIEIAKLHKQSLFGDKEVMNLSIRDRQASPSISMNLSSYFNGSLVELRLITIFGVLVQLCVVGYSAMITYYRPWMSHFTKAGGPVSTAAFPLMMAGTIMVSGGMFICALVIENCTAERAWKRTPANTEATGNQPSTEADGFRLLWLQKHKVVNDQAFKSCAILAHDPENPRTKLFTSDVVDSPRTDTVSSPLKLGSIVGVLISLVGFILQFSGLRLMNWSATLAQLIGMAIMTITRAYLRISLVDQPKTLPADHDYELDWLASRLVAGSKYLWDLEDEKSHAPNPHGLSFWWLLGTDEVLFEKKSEEQNYCKEKHDSSEEEQGSSKGEQSNEEQQHQQEEQGSQQEQRRQRKQQQAMRLWEVRQRLGLLSPWTSDYVDISKAVSLAIESVMGIVRAVNADPPLIQNSFRWLLKGRWSDFEVVPFTLSFGNDENRPWGSPREIEAALSTWSYFLDRLSEDRKIVRSLEYYDKSIRQDITQWAGQKETGLLLFDLLDGGGPSVPHKLLSDSTRPLGALLAQRVFLWFMLDLAEHLSSPIPKAATVTFLDDNNPTIRGTRLDHPTLTAMVQKIQQSGLASIEEAWDMVVSPLSYHRKLPSPITIVEKMRDRSKTLEQTGQWGQVLKIQAEVVEVSKRLKHEPEAYYRATAIVVDTYRRISSILDVQIEQLRRLNRLTQLQLVEEELKKIIDEDMEPRIVRALIGFYTLQKPRSPCPEQVRIGGKTKRLFDIGRFGAGFRALVQNSGQGGGGGSFEHIARAIQDLPTEIDIQEGNSDDVLQRSLLRFDWELKSACYPDPLGLTLTHHVMIRGVKDVGSVLDLVAPESDSVTSASDIAGWTSLHYASMSNDVQRTIMELWRHGGSVHALSRDGMTPLHCLAKTGTQDEVAHLLALGATPTAQDNSGYTPLHWAAWCGNVGAIEVLLSKGADPGSRDNYGRTALHLATIAWKEEAVAVLSYRSGIGAQDVDGNTALHYAAMLGNRSLASRETGREDNMSGVEDEALVTALSSGKNQTRKEEAVNRDLDQKGNDKECPDLVSQANSSVDRSSKGNKIASRSFKASVLHCVNVDGNAPIHVAIEHGHYRVVNTLLEAGEQRRETAYGTTPLRLAVVFGHPKVVESLVKSAHNDEPNPERLFTLIDELQNINRSLKNSKLKRIGWLRMAAFDSVEVGAQSSFFSPFMLRLWHRMQGKDLSSIESLQEAYCGRFSARVFNSERTYASEEYIKDLTKVREILQREKGWARDVPQAGQDRSDIS